MSDTERNDRIYVIGSVIFVIGLGLVWGPGGLLVAVGISLMVAAIFDGTNRRPPPGETDTGE